MLHKLLVAGQLTFLASAGLLLYRIDVGIQHHKRCRIEKQNKQNKKGGEIIM